MKQFYAHNKEKFKNKIFNNDCYMSEHYNRVISFTAPCLHEDTFLFIPDITWPEISTFSQLHELKSLGGNE